MLPEGDCTARKSELANWDLVSGFVMLECHANCTADINHIACIHVTLFASEHCGTSYQAIACLHKAINEETPSVKLPSLFKLNFE